MDHVLWKRLRGRGWGLSRESQGRASVAHSGLTLSPVLRETPSSAGSTGLRTNKRKSKERQGVEERSAQLQVLLLERETNHPHILLHGYRLWGTRVRLRVALAFQREGGTSAEPDTLHLMATIQFLSHE